MLSIVSIVMSILAVVVAMTLIGWFCRPMPVPMEVLLADWRQRAIVRRQLGDGVRRLRRLVRCRGGAEAALLVVEWLPDGKRAECQPIRRRGDGVTTQLITLALTSGERRYTANELLAAVAEHYLALGSSPGRRLGAPAAANVASTPERLRALLTDLGSRDGAAS